MNHDQRLAIPLALLAIIVLAVPVFAQSGRQTPNAHHDMMGGMRSDMGHGMMDGSKAGNCMGMMQSMQNEDPQPNEQWRHGTLPPDRG